MENKKELRTEAELIALAQSGEERAMEELLYRYADLVKGCARGFFLVGGETDDLVQEGMIGLHGAIVHFRQDEASGSFKNFAYMCVRRRIIDAVKRASSKKNSPLNDGISAEDVDGWLIYSSFNPEDRLIHSDERREIKQEMVRVLSDFEYKVFTLYMDGLSNAQICETTGKSDKSVSNAIQRSKVKLQAALKKEKE
jgi:RNA polymerase sporulation-specific sigma factor